jgi:DNA-binding SARP family transcriptional activator
MENYIGYLESAGRTRDAIPFLEALTEDNQAQVGLRQALAQQYQRAGRNADAIAQLDAAADGLMERGDKAGAAALVNQILGMNPPNAEDYRQVLAQLQ